jgi:hypothetical protein
MGRLVAVLVMVMALGLAEATAAAAGGRRHSGTVFGPGKGHSGFSGKNTTGSLSTRPVDPWRSWGVHGRKDTHIPDRRRPGFGGGFAPFIPFGGSNVAVASTVSSPTLIIYEGGPEPAVGFPFAATAAVPPVASLVEYAEGWYQLQGDGISTPYRWIWIPRPPPPPLAAAPVPPAGPRPSNPVPEPAAAGPRIGDAYSWTDEQGVTSWTNRPERIPPRYRDRMVAPSPDPAPR